MLRSIQLMASAILPLTLILVFCQRGQCEVFHVLPSPSVPCLAGRCATLSEFANNSSNLLKFNTKLIFLPGNHRIASELIIANISSFSMFTLSNSSSSVIFSCEEYVGVSFESIDEVNIRGLRFVECSYHRAKLVKWLRIEDCTFINHTRTAVMLINSSACIVRTSFLSNLILSPNHYLSSKLRKHKVGGAISVIRSNIIIEHCILEGNSADIGGAIFTELKSNITIFNSTFVENHVPFHGGVLYSDRGYAVAVHNSNFVRNSAREGGVFVVEKTILFIHESDFIQNNVVINGGAVYAYQGSLLIFKSQFICNFANRGGVLDVAYVNLTITHSVFNENKAKYAGVISAPGLSFIVLIMCNFTDNIAENLGGVLQLSSSIVLVRQAIIVGNKGHHGGSFDINSVNITLVDSELSHNSAQLGGVIYATETNINITNCVLSYNEAIRGGVVHIATGSSIITNKSVMKRNLANLGVMYFVESSGIFSATEVADNKGSLFLYYSNITFKGETDFVNCRPRKYHTTNFQEGGAITAFQSNIILEGTSTLAQNSAQNGGAVHLTESKLYVYGNTILSNNTALESGGGIYIYQSELNCKGQSTLQLVGNRAIVHGGGIHAIGSTLVAEYEYTQPHNVYHGSRIIFIGNNAKEAGGGILLEVNSKLNVLIRKQYYSDEPYYTLIFSSNSADYGGAIYVADDTNSGTCASTLYKEHSTSNECFMQVIVLNYRYISHRNHMNIKFTQNFALSRGSNLYGGLFDRCTLSPFSRFKLKWQHPDPVDIIGLLYFTTISNTTDLESISSSPVRVCFCNNSQPDCNYWPPPIQTQRGKKFKVSLVAVDQANHTVGAKLHSFLVSNESGIGEGQLIQDVNENCTDLSFEVFSPHDYEELIVYADGPCKDAELSQTRIKIQFSPCECPTGFQHKATELKRCVCVCDSKLEKHISTCSYRSQILLRESNVWIAYINVTNYAHGYIVYPYCPLGYCKPSSSKVKLNLNVPNGADAQCAEHRTGTLCGRCLPDFSLSIGSSRCITCSAYWPVVFIVILLASLLAGIALVALLLTLNLTVAIGTLNGIIFYANVVNANSNTFFPFRYQRSTISAVFIAWLNLEPGLDLCFISNLDAYWKTWLQLVFPTYVIFLVVMVILISEKSKRFSQLIGRKNPVATLATLILLSYAKLLHTVIAALSSVVLHYPGPDGGHYKLLWLPDVSVEYLKGRHIALFIAAVFILVAGIIYTTILFSWQWILCFNQWTLLKWTRNQKLALFIETYHAPYTPRNRYWTGLLLFVCAILYIASAANVSGDPRINLLTTGSAIIGISLLN